MHGSGNFEELQSLSSQERHDDIRIHNHDIFGRGLPNSEIHSPSIPHISQVEQSQNCGSQ